MIFWRMGSAGVNYRPADWKVRMRRDSDWRQLRTMKPAAFKRVIAALTPAQRRRVAEIEANFSENGQRWRSHRSRKWHRDHRCHLPFPALFSELLNQNADHA